MGRKPKRKPTNWWFVFSLAMVMAMAPLLFRLVFGSLNGNAEYMGRVPLYFNFILSLIAFLGVGGVAFFINWDGNTVVKVFSGIVIGLTTIGVTMFHFFWVVLGPAIMLIIDSGVMGAI